MPLFFLLLLKFDFLSRTTPKDRFTPYHLAWERALVKCLLAYKLRLGLCPVLTYIVALTTLIYLPKMLSSELQCHVYIFISKVTSIDFFFFCISCFTVESARVSVVSHIKKI
jgi:hypothetical protein